MMRSLTPFFSILFALIAYFFFTRPTLDEAQAIKVEAGQYSEAVGQAKELNQVLSTLLAKKNSYSTYDKDRLDALVPVSVDEVKRLVDLKEMARSHNMLIGNISVEKSKSGDNTATNDAQQIGPDSFATSDISFSVIGTYDQLKAMLHDIERSLVLLEVTHLSFNANQGNLQQFNVTVRAFALPSEKK